MKRFFTVALVALMTMSAFTVNAQNKFKGIVRYNIKSTGTVAIEIPANRATSEIKVMGDKLITEGQMQEGLTVYSFLDLSGLIGYLNSQDITLESYEGDGKIFIKHTYTQNEIDSLTIPCTEGYYIEYVAGESKKICGYDAKLAKIHMFNDEGTEKIINMWYTDEIGPQVNFLMNGIKGMPLEYSQDVDADRQITMTAGEIVKGKVKDVDFLMPAGHKELDQDSYLKLMKEVQETIELLQE